MNKLKYKIKINNIDNIVVKNYYTFCINYFGLKTNIIND